MRELTGQDADQGIWARVQDAMAAFSGAVGSAVTQNSDQTGYEHSRCNCGWITTRSIPYLQNCCKAMTRKKFKSIFGQIYKDLTAHAEAEEEVVYPRVRAFYGETNTQELYDEQADVKRRLEKIKSY